MSSTPESGRLVGGRYRLEKVLGEGGMAVVWRAVHTETDRTVALKLVRPNLLENDQARELFVRESRIAARIGRSDHIVDVLDAGIDPELQVPFLVMELLEGEPLDVRLRRDGPVSRELAAELVEQLGDALDQAHDAGVIHRDLKPQNLFLSKDRKGKTIIKILDFGIAKLSETALESATQIGTPAYSAPEQLGQSWRAIAARNGAVIQSTVTRGTDIWALGLVVYEMLTGATSGAIWGATTLAELPVKIVLEPTPSARERAGPRAHLLPPNFDPWIARCLALDTANRWARAGEATKALATALRSGGSAQAQGLAPQGPQPQGHQPQQGLPQQGLPQQGLPQHTPYPQAPQPWPTGTPPPPMQRAQSYPQLPNPQVAYPPSAATGPTGSYPPPAAMNRPMGSYPPQAVTAGGPWMGQGLPMDPHLAAWVAERRIELRAAHLGEIKSFEPWKYVPTAGRAGREIRTQVDDAHVRIAEIYGSDVISQAMGEERTILALLVSPRVRFRVSLRSKQSAGLADEIGRGLKLLDGLVGTSEANAKSIGDRFLETHFDVSSPSAQEGHAALTVALRHILVNGGFRGTLEMKPGVLAVSHQAVKSLDPIGLDFSLGFLVQAYRSLV